MASGSGRSVESTEVSFATKWRNVMSDLSRRAFGQGTLGSLLTYSLLETLSATDAFGEEVKPITATWLADVNEISQELKGQPLEQVKWQEQIEALMKQIDLPELLKFIDFEKLTANIPFRDKGERSLRPRLPKVEGLPTNLVFGASGVCAEERSLCCSPRPQQHGHRVSDSQRRLSWAALRPAGRWRRPYDYQADDRSRLQGR